MRLTYNLQFVAEGGWSQCSNFWREANWQQKDAHVALCAEAVEKLTGRQSTHDATELRTKAIQLDVRTTRPHNKRWMKATCPDHYRWHINGQTFRASGRHIDVANNNNIDLARPIWIRLTVKA